MKINVSGGFTIPMSVLPTKQMIVVNSGSKTSLFIIGQLHELANCSVSSKMVYSS